MFFGNSRFYNKNFKLLSNNNNNSSNFTSIIDKQPFISSIFGSNNSSFNVFNEDVFNLLNKKASDLTLKLSENMDESFVPWYHMNNANLIGVEGEEGPEGHETISDEAADTVNISFEELRSVVKSKLHNKSSFLEASNDRKELLNFRIKSHYFYHADNYFVINFTSVYNYPQFVSQILFSTPELSLTVVWPLQFLIFYYGYSFFGFFENELSLFLSLFNINFFNMLPHKKFSIILGYGETTSDFKSYFRRNLKSFFDFNGLKKRHNLNLLFRGPLFKKDFDFYRFRKSNLLVLNKFYKFTKFSKYDYFIFCNSFKLNNNEIPYNFNKSPFFFYKWFFLKIYNKFNFSYLGILLIDFYISFLYFLYYLFYESKIFDFNFLLETFGIKEVVFSKNNKSILRLFLHLGLILEYSKFMWFLKLKNLLFYSDYFSYFFVFFLLIITLRTFTASIFRYPKQIEETNYYYYFSDRQIFPHLNKIRPESNVVEFAGSSTWFYSLYKEVWYDLLKEKSRISSNIERDIALDTEKILHKNYRLSKTRMYQQSLLNDVYIYDPKNFRLRGLNISYSHFPNTDDSSNVINNKDFNYPRPSDVLFDFQNPEILKGKNNKLPFNPEFTLYDHLKQLLEQKRDGKTLFFLFKNLWLNLEKRKNLKRIKNKLDFDLKKKLFWDLKNIYNNNNKTGTLNESSNFYYILEFSSYKKHNFLNSFSKFYSKRSSYVLPSSQFLLLPKDFKLPANFDEFLVFVNNQRFSFKDESQKDKDLLLFNVKNNNFSDIDIENLRYIWNTLKYLKNQPFPLFTSDKSLNRFDRYNTRLIFDINLYYDNIVRWFNFRDISYNSRARLYGYQMLYFFVYQIFIFNLFLFLSLIFFFIFLFFFIFFDFVFSNFFG